MPLPRPPEIPRIMRKILREASGWGKPCVGGHRPFIAFFQSRSFAIVSSSQLVDFNHKLTKICVEAFV